MRYGVLGPLEVRDGERPVEVRGAKQRALLAVLLLHGNRVVSTGGLIDALWQDDPPETAAKALQVYVSQLRKLLGKERLLTRPPGYLLSVADGELDRDEFDALVRRARGASPAEAAGTLREALALWRGPPLADFVFDRFAQAEIARLEEARLAVVEDRLDIALSLGRHREVIGELEALVGEHPLRERLRAQLMLALYRSGRQAEALSAYQDARRALVDGLGIDPGRRLRELEQAILRQDPSLEIGVDADAERATPARREPPPPPAAGRERKLATVLFAELAAGTGQESDPERTRATVETLCDAMTEEVARAGGRVERLTGTAAIAVFGLPAAQEDHARRALHAALAMRARFAAVVGDEHAVGIGVDTGEVVLEETSEGRFLATGHSVSAAARLAEVSRPGEVLVGGRTVAAARGAFEFARPRSATGRAGGTTVAPRALLRAAAAGSTPARSVLRRAFVGRERELELMRGVYRHVVDHGEPHLVTVVGEAGIGKTSLVRELTEWLAHRSPEPLLRSGRCLPYGRGITYWPLGEILRQHLGLIESDPPETVRERLAGDAILGLTLGLDVAAGLHPLAAREELHAAWAGLLERLAAARPVVVVVEDVHWAEQPLLDLLARLLRDVSGPLLLVITARPEGIDGRGPRGVSHRRTTQLWLDPLALDETGQMVEQLLGPEVPARLRRLLVEQADGNPFFVEEIVAALVDRRYLVRDNGSWRLRDLPARLSVPDSIESLLAARLDLLGPAEKQALQAASVIGRVFWAGPVAALVDGADFDLGVLVERDLIRRRPVSSFAGEREFGFKHALTRDVAYESLPKEVRARLHAAFAAWIERAGGGRDEHAPLLAHHYAESVRPEDVDLCWPNGGPDLDALRDKARTWLRRAAEQARAKYALDEQASLLRAAVELEQSDAGRVALWREIAQAHALNYDDAAFKDAIASAVELTTDERARMECYGDYVFQCSLRWQQELDRPRIDEWSRVVLERSGDGSRARAQALVARAVCHPEEAESAAREAEAIAARLDDVELRSYALYIRADVALAAADYGEAQRVAEERLRMLDRVDDPDHRADACWAALPAFLGSGRFADARRIAQRHDEITERLTPHHRLHGVAVLLEVEQLAGDWERIRELRPRAEESVDKSTTRCLHNRLALLTCALASAYLGDDAEARRLEARSEESGIDNYGRTESLIWLALHRGDLAAVERALAELERPAKSFLRSRKLAPVAARLDALAALGRRQTLESEAPPLVRPGTYVEPFALRALAVVRDDEQLARQAVERFEAMSLHWHAGQTLAALAGARRAR